MFDGFSRTAQLGFQGFLPPLRISHRKDCPQNSYILYAGHVSSRSLLLTRVHWVTLREEVLGI